MTIQHNNASACNVVLQNSEEVVHEMLDRTERTGNEQIVILIETKDGMYSTDIVEGDEESINQKITSDLGMDSKMLAMENTEGGTTSPDQYNAYEIHTHPNGYNEQSLADIKSIINGLSDRFPKNRTTSHLVATNLDDGKELFGMYSYEELSSQDIKNTKAVLRAIEGAMSDIMTTTAKKSRLIEELTDIGYTQCRVTL